MNEATQPNQYLLAIYQPGGAVPAPKELEPVMRRVNALIREARDAGVLVLNAGLEPPDAATVAQLQRRETIVTDGPYVETKEHLGGFMIVRVADRGAALEWARKLAAALTFDGVDGLAIEVRALQPHN